MKAGTRIVRILVGVVGVVLLLVAAIGCATGPQTGDPGGGEVEPLEGRLILPAEPIEAENILQLESVRIAYPAGWRASLPGDDHASTAVLNLVHDATGVRCRIDRLAFREPVSFERLVDLLAERFGSPSVVRGRSESGPAAIIDAPGRVLVVRDIDGEIWAIEAIGWESLIYDRERNATFAIAASVVTAPAHASYRQIADRLTVVLMPPWRWIEDTPRGFAVAAIDRDAENGGSGFAVEIGLISPDPVAPAGTAAAEEAAERDNSADPNLRKWAPFFDAAYRSGPESDRRSIVLTTGSDGVELTVRSGEDFPELDHLDALLSGIVFAGVTR